MVKCFVTGCCNRPLSVKTKRFFSFPKDRERIKVWLAALREADKPDGGADDDDGDDDQRLICEDHFLPEHLCQDGVTADAIPIMPHCMDGLGMVSPWEEEEVEEEEEEHEEEEEEEEEEELHEHEEEEEEEEKEEEQKEETVESESIPVKVEPPSPPALPAFPSIPALPVQQDIKLERTQTDTQSSSLPQTTDKNPKRKESKDESVGVLTKRFLRLMLASPDGSLDLLQATARLHTTRQKVYDITNMMNSIKLIHRKSPTHIYWTGTLSISDFLLCSESRTERDNLRLVEERLDMLIKSCAQQLFNLTDDKKNSALAYVSHADISRLSAFQNQTVLVVKAPEETKLDVPPPSEDSIQIHLKGGRGPIVVVTCDLVNPSGSETNGGFTSLEGSRIKTNALHKDSLRPPTA